MIFNSHTIKRKGCFLLLLILLVSVTNAQVKDTLYFLNQTVLIGELKKINFGKIDFSADAVGDVSIKNDKIKTIKAASHAYRIETAGKNLWYGYIESSEKSGLIIINTGEKKVEISLASITKLSFYGKKWSTRINGNAGAGFSYTKSSDIGRLNVNSLIQYTNRKLEAGMDGSMMITFDSSSTLRERENVQLSGNYLMNNYWYTGAILSYQRSIQLGLLRRWQQGVGVGYKFLQHKNSLGKLITGMVINEEYYFDASHNTSLEWAVQCNYDFFSFSKPNINISTVQKIYFSLQDKSRIRYDGDFKLSWEMIKDFSLNFSLYHNYDSRSPVNSKANTDYGFITGLSYSF